MHAFLSSNASDSSHPKPVGLALTWVTSAGVYSYCLHRVVFFCAGTDPVLLSCDLEPRDQNFRDPDFRCH